MPETSPLSPLPVAEIERHLRWRVLAILSFIGVLAVLVVAALLPVLARPAAVSGLPDDPGAAEASRLLWGRLTPSGEGLRFVSALGGERTPDSRPEADLDDRLRRGRELIDATRRRLGRDPRAEAALAAIDLAQHRYASAERHYRAALARAPAYPEGRLGLGVALALRAGVERDPLVRRGLELKAIAQLAAGKPGEPEYDAALFDRAVLLERVGRREEAEQYRSAYLARDSASAWARRLREEAPSPGP
jgi:tetratricopeptide (TPR) repeat protein